MYGGPFNSIQFNPRGFVASFLRLAGTAKVLKIVTLSNLCQSTMSVARILTYDLCHVVRGISR